MSDEILNAVDFERLTRLTVVHHGEGGIRYERYGVAIAPDVQDDGRTLKLFVTDRQAGDGSEPWRKPWNLAEDATPAAPSATEPHEQAAGEGQATPDPQNAADDAPGMVLAGVRDGGCACDTDRCAEPWVEFADNGEFEVHHRDPERAREIATALGHLYAELVNNAARKLARRAVGAIGRNRDYPALNERYGAAVEYLQGHLQVIPEEVSTRLQVELQNAIAAGALWQHGRDPR